VAQARHPRFHMYFTPTSSSWLNMVERFFRDLTQQRLRRGIFRDVEDLIIAIGDYIDNYKDNPKPFVWTAKAADIWEKVKRARATLDNALERRVSLARLTTLHATGNGACSGENQTSLPLRQINHPESFAPQLRQSCPATHRKFSTSIKSSTAESMREYQTVRPLLDAVSPRKTFPRLRAIVELLRVEKLKY
jgi:hypothetical protein